MSLKKLPRQLYHLDLRHILILPGVTLEEGVAVGALSLVLK